MRNVLKRASVAMAMIVASCCTTIFAFAISLSPSDIIGYYAGIDNPQACMLVSGISGADDEVFVSAYYYPTENSFVVGHGYTSFASAGRYCFTMPKVRMCQKNGTNPSGYYYNCVLGGGVVRDSDGLYLIEDNYRYRKI